jgi:non-specific serine/threonine protein kinase
MVGGTVSHYRLVEKLGSGGMGVVYKAEDLSLGRLIALKFLPDELAGASSSLERFRREARAASALNHPNICTIYEVGEHEGRHFIAMELLEGETLAARIDHGPIPAPEVIQIALGLLGALQELHRKELVHRDLKPSNTFLATNGVKLIDFGLARLTSQEPMATQTELSTPGLLVGTPNYMSPEQLVGQSATPVSDLFAAGAILFEMLTGRRAFPGRSAVEIFHNIQYSQPPSLSGSPLITSIDRVVHRALAKNPSERYPTADAMAKDLRGALLLADSGVTPSVRMMSRLIVLPFRVLRPDPETEFLGFSLPDAIASSLSGLQSLIVRSSLVAARFAGEVPSLQTIAADADVDVVLTGTLLSSGDQLRVSTQLMEAPSGALIWSKSSQVALRDLFQLQDELVNRIVESLAIPLTAREHRRLERDVPANPTAYEYYLRGNLLYHDWAKMSVARDLYMRCVEEDPHYAPAWARLGRCHRLMAKWSGEPDENLLLAKSALDRALQCSPDLPIAHHIYAQLEADLGHPQDAMLRLLGRAVVGGNDPELFAGLTHVCRYCGLLEASFAAHNRARRLDPHIRTSVAHTYFMLGDFGNVLSNGSGGDSLYILPLALSQLGRETEAIHLLRERLQEPYSLPLICSHGRSLLALLEGRVEDSVQEAEGYLRGVCKDPESLYYLARQFAYCGMHARALELLHAVADQGYICFPVLTRDPWLDPLRGESEFRRLVQRVEGYYRNAEQAYLAAAGDRVLGVRPA